MADLRRLQRGAERHMNDEIRFTATPHTSADDPVDPMSGRPIPGSGDEPQEIYVGKCWIAALSQAFATPGEAPVDVGTYEIAVPVTASVPPPGAVGTVNACRSDPWLVGRELVVTETVAGSFIAARKVRAQLLVGARPRHAG